MVTILQISFAIFWIGSGLLPLLFNQAESIALLLKIGVPENIVYLSLYKLAMVNILLGLAIFLKNYLNIIAGIQFLVLLIYTIILTVALPYYWLDPMGGLIKNIPILAITWVLARRSRAS